MSVMQSNPMGKIMDKPNYYSITPAEVRYDSKLTASQKLLYGELTTLANKEGYCFATNNYFAKLYDVARETVSRWISKLEERGHVKVVLIRNGKQIIQRRIYITKTTPIDENVNTPIDENVNTPIDENVNTPIDENVKGNSTRNNNTSINKANSENSNLKYQKTRMENIKRGLPNNNIGEKARPLFKDFFENYPLRFDEIGTANHFHNLTEEEKKKAIESIAYYKKYLEVFNQEYIIYPSNYLKKKRFNDDWKIEVEKKLKRGQGMHRIQDNGLEKWMEAL